jgi:hypothetical protein
MTGPRGESKRSGLVSRGSPGLRNKILYPKGKEKEKERKPTKRQSGPGIEKRRSGRKTERCLQANRNQPCSVVSDSEMTGEFVHGDRTCLQLKRKQQ